MDNSNEKSTARQAGRATSNVGLMGYSAESERSFSGLSTIPVYKVDLQNPDGSFRFGEDPLGTNALIPGRYWIDSFGRRRPY